MKLTYLATVQDGKMIEFNRKRFEADLKQFEGKRIALDLYEAKKNRSNSQNAYYWSVVLPLAAQGLTDLGNEGITVDLAHRFFKDRFIERDRDIVIPLTGEVFKTKTTTDFSTTEMIGYIDSIIRFCAEFLNVIIPDPQ